MDENIRGTIVLLLDSQRIGGIESHVILLAKTLKKRGMDPLILFMRHYGKAHPLESKIQTLKLEFEYLDGSISLLSKRLRNACLLHTHGYKAGITGRLAGKITRTPVISTFHNGDLGQGRMKIYTMLDRITSYLSSNIAVSQEIAEQLPFNQQLIPNFVDIPDPPIRSSGKAIGFVGRLSHEKGPDIYIDLAAKNTQLPFHIYGDGPMRSALEAIAPDNVTFMGMQNNMTTHWPDIGLLCISSRNEGLPLVALEAMSSGIPVLASCIGGLPALIQANKNGWLAPAGDIDRFSAHLQHWLDMGTEKKVSMAECCIETISQHYSCDALVPRILHIYRQALH